MVMPGGLLELHREHAGDGGEGCLDLPEFLVDALGCREQGTATR